jgi:hypothetical protein
MISIIFYEDDILVLTSSSFDDHLWKSETFSNGSTTTTFKSMPKNQASVHWRPNT